MATRHANSAREALVKMCTLPLLAVNDEALAAGWGDCMRSRTSPNLQRKLAIEDQQDAGEAAQAKRERQARWEEHVRQNTQAAIRQRLEAGEVATPALLRGEGLGRTPTEFVQYRTAMMDVDDAREQAKYRREFEKWAPEGGVSADTSAHVEQAERRPRRRRSGSPSGPRRADRSVAGRREIWAAIRTNAYLERRRGEGWR